MFSVSSSFGVELKVKTQKYFIFILNNLENHLYLQFENYCDAM